MPISINAYNLVNLYKKVGENVSGLICKLELQRLQYFTQTRLHVSQKYLKVHKFLSSKCQISPPVQCNNAWTKPLTRLAYPLIQLPVHAGYLSFLGRNVEAITCGFIFTTGKWKYFKIMQEDTSKFLYSWNLLQNQAF